MRNGGILRNTNSEKRLVRRGIGGYKQELVINGFCYGDFAAVRGETNLQHENEQVNHPSYTLGLMPAFPWVTRSGVIMRTLFPGAKLHLHQLSLLMPSYEVVGTPGQNPYEDPDR